MGRGIPRASPAWFHRKLLLAWELPTPGCSGLCRFCRGRTDRSCESCWAAAPWGWPLTAPSEVHGLGTAPWPCHSPSFSSSLSSSSSALDPPLFSSFSSCGRSLRGFLEKWKHRMSRCSAGAEGEQEGGCGTLTWGNGVLRAALFVFVLVLLLRRLDVHQPALLGQLWRKRTGQTTPGPSRPSGSIPRGSPGRRAGGSRSAWHP